MRASRDRTRHQFALSVTRLIFCFPAQQQPPAERANSLIAALPGSSLVSKTGFVVLSTGALATAISQELYVVSEETVVLVGFVAIFSYIAKALRTPYKEWAHEKINVRSSNKGQFWNDLSDADFIAHQKLVGDHTSRTHPGRRRSN